MVKSEVIKARIKFKFPNVNLSNKRLDALAAKLKAKPADDASEEDIDSIIDSFNDVYSFEEIAKEDDRIRNLEAKVNAFKTPEEIAAEAEAKKAAEAAKTAAEEAAKGAPDWFKAYTEQQEQKFEQLQKSFTEFKEGTTTKSKLNQVKELIGNSESLKALTPEAQAQLIKTVDLTSETSIEDQVKGLETTFGGMKPPAEDTPLIQGQPPAPIIGKGAPSEADVDSVVDDL